MLLVSVWFYASAFAESKDQSTLPSTIYVYGSEALFDFRLNHTVAVVKAALDVDSEKLGVIDVRSTSELDLWMNRSRAIKSITENSDFVHVLSSFASRDLDEKLLAVPMSIAASTLGERLVLVRPDDRPIMDKIKNLEELKKFTFGVGQDWIDGDILLEAGFRVKRSARYDLLFPMLEAKRFDMLSRAAHEAWDELRTRGFRGIDWESSWILSYPAPFYLYVNQEQKALAKRLLHGLQKLEANGVLAQLYVEHFGPALLRSNWQARRRFSISNSFLPTTPPVNFTSWEDWHKKAEQDLKVWYQLAEKRFRPSWSDVYRPQINLLEKSDSKGTMITIRAADRPNDTHMLSAVFAVESAFQHKVNEKSDYYQRSVRYLIEVGLDQQTALENLKLEKSSLDIVATQSSQERESLYASVKVDLAQGLIGTRILVVHRDNIHNFRGVETVADLQKFRICVGRDWPDRLVLEHAKIPVLTRLHTNELYEALEAKQCDALTRAIYEVRDELLARPLQAIAVDPYLVLHYPASQQVFLAKGRPKLKAALESGLKELEREGILSEILELVYGDSIRHVEFKGRKVLDLTNPAAPDWLVQKQQILQQRAWYR